MSEFDGRFAPSPTGELHLGNLRTALLAWLYARSRGARFLLRVEDLDRERSRSEHERSQLADLRRIGIDWDASPPVRQSARTELYRAALESLHEQGRTYRCWCSRAEIRAAASAPHGPHGGADFGYPGTCRGAASRPDGHPFAWRLDARGMQAAFADARHGRQTGRVDDFVLWRSDDTPAYNLAVVVDDAEQRIGEVVRGEDLLSGTARQVYLQQLLGLHTPLYRHVPLLRGPDGERLAKRHGAISLSGRRGSVLDTVGWMAWTVGLIDRPEPTSARELLARFDPQRSLQAATSAAATGIHT